MASTKKVTKKVSKEIKKKIGPVGLIVVVIFLTLGLGFGFFIGSKMNSNKERKETNISLIGDSIKNIKLGDEYTDEGFNFIIDGVDYKDSVKTIGKVDNEVGQYIIEYTLEYNSNVYTLTRIINVGE